MAKAEVERVETPELEHSHRREDIDRRLSRPMQKSYLRDAIFGAIDGAVTTFAVVSGVSGAGLSPKIVIILGLANLVGDGFSMAAGNFLGARAENQEADRLRSVEQKHIQVCPEGEREEIRQILLRQGYQGKLLDATVDHITADEERWVNLMMQHEYGVAGSKTAAFPAAVVTFLSFCVIGFLPLFPFVGEWLFGVGGSPFVLSSLLTAAAFFGVGAVKSKFVEQHWLWSATETLLVGSVAAGLAYLCGYLLSGIADV
ncbi:MAG: VIT1/CCC1 transporter family protein [bacterium]|nr:VIT1/CCC1 transporter family protein [bacterium]